MKKAESFYYSPLWRELRKAALRRDKYRCAGCGADVSGIRGARVDHVLTRKEHPELALSLDNLRVLCPACDNRRHAEKARLPPQAIDADGWPAA